MKHISLFFLLGFLVSACTYHADKIAIQPFNDIDDTVIDSISSILSKTYNSQVYVLAKRQLPKSAFINVKSPRYRADSLLKYLKEIKPDSINLILGLTSKDISTTKRDDNGNVKKPESKYKDWGVFGLGYRPGSASVISTYRIKKTSIELFIERIQKISTHEIGHNIGLKHCPYTNCVMQDAAETIATVDQAGFELCSECKKKVK